ncbi:RDD family protein [Roseomonas populi]|uniref:RDD family protein n=1 Tax=Roseomonas populi TaxID=3121582 RepID=A0ABT1X015_9PROT|nr:RDD family protein [Roseomonas pecuniae]MCR0981441.1 RDD family protein [Roseomonas pecuniae]
MSDGRGVELAGFWPRVAAQLIDAAWMLPLGLILSVMGEGLRGGQDLSPGADLLLQLISALIILLFWVTRQATPGKLVMRLRVVDADTGGMPPFPRLVARYIGYIVSGLPLGLGYLWMLWDPRRQCWHDRLARTLVVQDPPPRD